MKNYVAIIKNGKPAGHVFFNNTKDEAQVALNSAFAMYREVDGTRMVTWVPAPGLTLPVISEVRN